MDAQTPSTSSTTAEACVESGVDAPPLDRTEWNETIRAYGPRVIAHLAAQGVRIDRAKEIANDAWTRLLEGQRDGRLGEMKMPGLVLQQATYLARDAARRGRWEITGETLPDVVDRAPSMEDVLTSKETLARARQAFDGSPPAEQRIFLALYEEPQRSGRDIAVAFGVSEQRVKQVAYEVRKRIRAALKKHDEGES